MRTTNNEHNAASPVTPLRYPPKEAAALLRIDVMYLYQLIAEGVFDPIRPSGKGRGRRLYLDTGEVKAFARGGRTAVAEYQRQKPTV